MARKQTARTTKRPPYVITVRGPGLRLDLSTRSLGSLARTVLGNLASPPDHYATLGVQPGATEDEINDAYFRKLVKTLPNDVLEKAIRVAVAERDQRANAS